MSLTTEQTLMHEVVNRIADKYVYAKTDQMVADAEKITSAILNYKNEDKSKADE